MRSWTAVRQRYHSCANVLRPRPQLAARQSWAELIVVLAFKIAGLDKASCSVQRSKPHCAPKARPSDPRGSEICGRRRENLHGRGGTSHRQEPSDKTHGLEGAGSPLSEGSRTASSEPLCR